MLSKFIKFIAQFNNQYIKPLLQLPVIVLVLILGFVAQPVQASFPITAINQDFDANELRIVITPDFYPIIWRDAERYGALPNSSGASACIRQEETYDNTFYDVHECPQAAINAGAVSYKQQAVNGYGLVVFFFDVSGNVIGSSADFDGDGYGDKNDTDIDGDGCSNTSDVFDRDPSECFDSDGDGIGDNADPYPYDDGQYVIDRVGSVPGQFSVSQSGAATYTVPIAVPPGTAGVQPQLSVNYNSQSGNGLLGIGWSLSGLSVITRCPSSLAIDNKVGGVALDETDRFCLDGKRLMGLPGAPDYGSNGKEYRTEIDNFSRIISYGISGAGPSYFKVWTKSGEVMEYGITSDSRVEAQGRSEVMVWALNKVSDTYGNYFKVVYQENNATGEHYPDRIEYTGNDAAGLQPDQTVQFHYNNRSDLVTGYIAGSKNTITKQLNKISTPGFNYVFEYETTGITQRNRLKSVMQCDIQDRCLPKATFNWQSFSEGLEYNSNYTNNLPDTYFRRHYNHSEDMGTRLVDIDGDGLKDIIRIYPTNDAATGAGIRQVYLNTGSQFNLDSTYSNSLPDMYLRRYRDKDNGVRLGDINGDGLVDLIQIYLEPNKASAKKRVYINTGTSFISSPSYTSSLPDTYFSHDRHDMGTRLVDINGDSLLDLVQIWDGHSYYYGGSDQRKVYLNTGSGFDYNHFYSVNLPETYFSARTDKGDGNYDLGTRFADLNGDSLPDLVQIFNDDYFDKYPGTGTLIKRAYINTGTYFAYNHTFTTSLPDTPISTGAKASNGDKFTYSSGVRLVDLNGDGLVEIVRAWDRGEHESYRQTYLNTGKQFSATPSAAYSLPSNLLFNFTGDRGATNDSSTRFADINADGLVDVLRIFNTTIDTVKYVYLNTGAGYERSTYHEGLLPDNIYFNSSYLGYARHDGVSGAMLADINGDAADDLISIYHDGNTVIKSVYLNKTTAPLSLITKFTGSLGDETSISYKPLTDSAVYDKEYFASGTDRMTNPERTIISPMQVVERVQKTNGLGGTVSSRYHYSRLKTHLQGHGSLGFRRLIVTDEQTGVKVETHYSQTHPYAGMATAMYKKKPNGQLLSYSVNTPQSMIPAGMPTDGSGSVFAFVGQTLERNYDYDSGQLLKEVTTTTSYDGPENGGNFGNATSITVHTINKLNSAETFTTTTESRYEPANTSGSNWILGRVKNVKVTKLQNGQSDVNSERTSSFTYNTNGVLRSETVLPDESSPLILTMLKQYDAYGNITKDTTCDTDAASCAHDTGNFRTTTTEYDSRGRYITRVTNALGQYEDRTYHDLFGVITSQTGPNSLTTNWYYDSFGRQIREERADGTQSSIDRQYCSPYCPVVGGVEAKYSITSLATGTVATTEYYDNHDRKIRVQTTGFNGQNIYTDTGYDSQGRVARASIPYTDGETPLWLTNIYDTYSRVTEVSSPLGDFDGDGTDNGYIISRRYTFDGYSTEVIDIKGRSTTEVMNAAGQKVQVIDAEGNSVQYQYNSQGDLKKTIDAAGNEINLTYDNRGRKKTMSDPDMGNWSYSYNGYGELVNQTDAKGQQTTMGYDKLGRLTSRINLEGTSTWTYGTVFDSNNRNVGKLIRSNGPQNNEIKDFAYDSLGRLKSTTQTFSIAPYTNNTSYTVSQTYESLTGKLSTLSYPQVDGTNFQVRRIYNNFGYLSEIQSLDGNIVYWKGTQSNSQGQITSEELGNGLTTSRVYNHATGWLLGVDTGNTTSTVQHSTYSFDVAGNIVKRIDHRQQINGLTETFLYDNLDRLKFSSIQNNIDTSSVYPAKGYTYDAVGNLKVKDGITYRYGNDCAIGFGPHAVCEIYTGSSVDAYSYDLNGNMIAGGGRTVSYTSFNKPYQFIKGSENVNFHYGVDQSRIFKLANTTQTTYIGLGAEGGTLYEREVDTANNKTTHIHFIYAVGRQPVAMHRIEVDDIAQTSQTANEYFHRDHLGSVEAITDQAANIVAYKSHDAWGKRRNADWTDNTTGQLNSTNGHLCFTGHESIPEIGLIHMNGRVYDPDLGRFLSADPHIQFDSNLQSYNRYSYVLNNPLRYNDPTGYYVATLVGVVLTALEVEAVYIIAAVAVIGAAEAYAETGDFSTAVKVGLVTYASGLFASSIGKWAGNASYTSNTGKFFAKAGLHAIRGGLTSVALGGNFEDGAVGAFAATLGEPIMFGAFDKSRIDPGAVVGRTALAAIVGGTASRLSGGKFSNGAYTAAFKWLFNTEQRIRAQNSRRPNPGVQITKSVNGRDHKYLIRGEICSRSSQCNDDYAVRLYSEYANKNDVPLLGVDSGTGYKYLLPYNKIFHEEFISERLSVNTTTQKHMFHPGDVEVRVHFENDVLYYDVTGTGSGSFPSFNNDIGVDLFAPSVFEAVRTYGFD